MTLLTIEEDTPQRRDVAALLQRHLEFAHSSSPREHVHALDHAELMRTGVTLFSARDAAGGLLGIGALTALDDGHAEIKSMHTALEARRAGVGAAVLSHIIEIARARGYTRLSLETGTGPLFAPAQALYTQAGFTECEPFGRYTRNPHSVCMTLALR